jgi:hypothetical protein
MTRCDICGEEWTEEHLVQIVNDYGDIMSLICGRCIDKEAEEQGLRPTEASLTAVMKRMIEDKEVEWG